MPEEEKTVQWEKVKELFESVHALMKPEDTWTIGDEILFADFVVAAYIMMTRAVLRMESKEWKRLMSWHEGRCDYMMTQVEKYTAIH